eukprot:scaffold1515_cov119-Isochrysis_galbana.AAC.5
MVGKAYQILLPTGTMRDVGGEDVKTHQVAGPVHLGRARLGVQPRCLGTQTGVACVRSQTFQPLPPRRRRIRRGACDILQSRRRPVVKPVMQRLSRYIHSTLVPAVADHIGMDAVEPDLLMRLHGVNRHGLIGHDDDPHV